MRNSKKGAALILSMFLMIVLFSFISLSTYHYTTAARLNTHYENSLQVLYTLEAAQNALLWEEKQGNYNWDTETANLNFDSTPRLQGAEISVADGFYHLLGYPFRARVFNQDNSVRMYIHAFRGQENNPQAERYLEYTYTLSPMYQFMMFSNRSLTFGWSQLLNVRGGRIHTNQNIILGGGDSWVGGFRFNQIRELSASGTIAYRQDVKFPPPYYIDHLDRQDLNNNGHAYDGAELATATNGMAPAPYFAPSDDWNRWVTTGDIVDLDPYREYVFNSFQGWYLREKPSVSSMLRGSDVNMPAHWGIEGKVPFLWRGEESFFRGRQYIGSGGWSTRYNEVANVDIRYLLNNGQIVSSPTATEVNNFNLDFEATSLNLVTDTNGLYRQANVYFNPWKDASGNINNKWFEIPGALAESYPWAKNDKYAENGGYGYYNYPENVQKPVTFYATEACSPGSAGCFKDPDPLSPAISSSWRYIKKDIIGNCVTDNCYNDSDSNYIKAQDYTYADGIKYYDQFSPLDWDQNPEFFSDWTYGNDFLGSAPLDQIRALNTQKQPQGFSEYLGLLAEQNIEGVLKSGVAKKGPFLGRVFDDYTNDASPAGDSVYKQRAQNGGIYIDNSGKIWVNGQDRTECFEDKDVARPVTFFNWKSSLPINLVEINLEELGQYSGGGGGGGGGGCPNHIDFNGVIYAKFPIRFSQAKDLPGNNVGCAGAGTNCKRAVFTTISEESIYLKGDYNHPNNPDKDWKISHLATKKRVYTLSDNFNDPQEPPTFRVYPEYPLVYVKTQDTNGDGVVDQYFQDEADPYVGGGIWLTGGESTAEHPNLDQATKNWIVLQSKNHQTNYFDNGILPYDYPHGVPAIDPPPNDSQVNQVAGSMDWGPPLHHYNSLFITPYDSGKGVIDLERWGYRTRVIEGAFLDFYDPQDPNYDDEYRSALGQEESDFDCRRLPGRTNYPDTCGWWLPSYAGGPGNTCGMCWDEIAYDPRFPQATPLTSEGILGFNGITLWRLIPPQYFTGCINDGICAN